MKKIPFFFIAWLFLSQSSAQVAPDEKIIAGLKKWNEENPQEKIFVQTDRDKYLTGEAIWFKLWCSLDAKPSFLSRIAYVVLNDAHGNVIEKKMYTLNDLASANGVIDIDRNVKSGNYTLCAYTLWMLNYPQYVFKKAIYIYNTDYKLKAASKSQPGFELNFFPEGGNLIEGIQGRVAFKAINSSGFPVNVQGGIFTGEGTKVVEFSSQHDGMGLFEFQPLANTSYIAKVNFENGRQAEYKLPQTQKEGITLQVNNSSPSRLFILVDRSTINKQKFNKLFVVAQMNGVPVYAADFNLDEGESGASIIKKNLPAGIMQITVFDTTGIPLAERLAFIPNYQINEPNITLQKINTVKRGQNIFSFRLDSVLNGELSALITDPTLSTMPDQKENIISSLLLSGDIKGFINNPGYYFTNKEDITLQNLDLLLMTQGWRRFTWKQIKGEENIVLKYPVETFMNIKGKVTKSDRSAPVTDGFVSLHIKGDDSTSILSNAYLTDKGEFIVDSLNFKTKALVSYEGTNNKKAQIPVDVTIYPSLIDTLKKSPYTTGLDLDTAVTSKKDAFTEYVDKGLLRLDTLGSVLENVTVRAKKLSPVDSVQKEYVSPFFQNSDQTLLIPENRSFTNIWQFLNASIPGFNVNPFQPGGVTNVVFSRYEGTSLDDSDSRYVKFLLNEIPVATEVIDALNPSDVAIIKVYKGATAFAFGADAGAISIYTKKGAQTVVYEKQFAKFTKIGFAYAREFYNPDYTAHPELGKSGQDNRLTLYWNPKIKPGKNGEYSIEFHNNDISKAFRLIIQGIDRNGRLVYKEQIIR